MPHQLFTVIPTMASLVGANDVDGLVPLQHTVLYIPGFLDALVEDAEDNLTYQSTHKNLLLKD
jgi:hypothetical protein